MRNLITVEETAKMLAVSPKTIRNWMNKGTMQIPYVKIGGCIRFRPEDVERFIDNRIVKPRYRIS